MLIGSCRPRWAPRPYLVTKPNCELPHLACGLPYLAGRPVGYFLIRLIEMPKKKRKRAPIKSAYFPFKYWPLPPHACSRCVNSVLNSPKVRIALCCKCGLEVTRLATWVRKILLRKLPCNQDLLSKIFQKIQKHLAFPLEHYIYLDPGSTQSGYDYCSDPEWGLYPMWL